MVVVGPVGGGAMAKGLWFPGGRVLTGDRVTGGCFLIDDQVTGDCVPTTSHAHRRGVGRRKCGGLGCVGVCVSLLLLFLCLLEVFLIFVEAVGWERNSRASIV